MRCLRAPLRTHAQACPRLCPRVLAATRDGAASTPSLPQGPPLSPTPPTAPRNRPRVAPPTVRRDMPPVATPPGGWACDSLCSAPCPRVPGSGVSLIPGSRSCWAPLTLLWVSVPRASTPFCEMPCCPRCGSAQKCNTHYSGYSSDKAQGTGYNRVLH